MLEFDDDFGTGSACCNCDFLEIWSGTGMTFQDTRRGHWYYDDHPHVYKVEGEDMYVYFRTDSVGSGLGFEFKYEACK